jgi:hypothetical protein
LDFVEEGMTPVVRVFGDAVDIASDFAAHYSEASVFDRKDFEEIAFVP